MRRFRYQLLGYVVWKGVAVYLRRRYGGAPKKLAVGALFAAILTALLVAQRRAGDDV